MLTPSACPAADDGDVCAGDAGDVGDVEDAEDVRDGEFGTPATLNAGPPARHRPPDRTGARTGT
ncbi:hypothetical protein GCM10022384_60780 [Streptomyces marokkonensis]|uniref:Uncharacterized protein n=1 Tax=Streptomyces marokkonensis TaxID=324855 RepID=A0ABP7S4I3_9ACTN